MIKNLYHVAKNSGTQATELSEFLIPTWQLNKSMSTRSHCIWAGLLRGFPFSSYKKNLGICIISLRWGWVIYSIKTLHILSDIVLMASQWGLENMVHIYAKSVPMQRIPRSHVPVAVTSLYRSLFDGRI